MALTIEAEITLGPGVAEAVELGRPVEKVGFDRLGISDVPLYPRYRQDHREQARRVPVRQDCTKSSALALQGVRRGSKRPHPRLP